MPGAVEWPADSFHRGHRTICSLLREIQWLAAVEAARTDTSPMLRILEAAGEALDCAKRMTSKLHEYKRAHDDAGNG